jgi:hypothetical protein
MINPAGLRLQGNPSISGIEFSCISYLNTENAERASEFSMCTGTSLCVRVWEILLLGELLLTSR